MRRFLSVGSLLLLSVVLGCGRSDLFEGAESPRDAVTVRRYSPPAAPVLRSQSVAVRRLIRTVDLQLTVTDTTATATSIRDLTAALGGYVGATDAKRRQTAFSYQMSLHIPAAQLDGAVARITDLATTVDRQRLLTEDVTDRIIDVDARLVSARATETELLALLEESRARQADLEDILAVYRELTRVRTEVEQYQAQLENLEQRVSLATVNLTLEPARPVTVASWSAGQAVHNSLGALVSILQSLATLAIFCLIVVLPVSLLVALPTWGTMRLWQHARKTPD